MTQPEQQSTESRGEAANRFRLSRKGLVAILLLEAVVLAWTTSDELTYSGNELSRWATVETLVEQGTFGVEKTSFPNVDQVEINGRFYSNKPLLLTLWIAGLYAPLHVLFGCDFAGAYHGLIRSLTWLGTGLFSVFLTFLFQARLRAQGVDAGRALAAGLAVVFTTWIWSYGTTLNNHTPAAAMVFAVFWLLELEARESRPRRAFGIGVLVGLLQGIDIPTGGVFLLVACAVYLITGKSLKHPQLWRFLTGYTLVTISLAGVNWAVYGYPLDAYLVPGAFAYEGGFHAPGVAGLRRPDNLVTYVFHITLGQRGVLSHMPALLLGLLYLWSRRRSLTLVDRAAAAAVFVLLSFYGSRTGIFGGWAYGFRFLIPVLPLLFWWSVLWLQESPRRGRQALFAALLLIGLLTSWVGAQNPWPVAYEGVGTKPDAVEANVRSPFMSNLLAWCFEQDPDGKLFAWLAEHTYGKQLTLAYLWEEFWNRRQPEHNAKLIELGNRWLKQTD